MASPNGASDRFSDEDARHERAILSLADELQAPATIVRSVYGHELERMRGEATVTEFLAVFVRKSARQCLVCNGEAKTGACATRRKCPLERLAPDDSDRSAPRTAAGR